MSPSVDSPSDSHESSDADGRFRVQDNARALWGVMGVLLILGFAVLRLLAGASDTPHVETSTATETTPSPANDAVPEDTIHRLRPQTSTALPVHDAPIGSGVILTDHIDRVPGDPMPWQLQPATPGDAEMAREPGVLR